MILFLIIAAIAVFSLILTWNETSTIEVATRPPAREITGADLYLARKMKERK